MPHIDGTYLLFGATFAIASRLSPRSIWPWLRDLIGLAFLWWWEPRSLLMLGSLSAGAWVGSRLRRRIPALSWLFLGLIGAAFVTVRISQRGQALDTLLAPAGFGFAVLRIVHWWVEQGRGGLPAHGPRQLFAWMIYFPTVLLGPVQRFEDWARWEGRHRWDAGDAALGLRRILYGYVRIVVLAFWLVGTVLPRWLLWLPASVAGAITATATLYLVFAGTSDIAIGLGRLGGQRVPENFDAPFLKTSLPAFWRAWHMTVTEWCRLYVFVPILARSRSVLLAAATAMAVFACWHELTLAYLAWGVLQALGLLAWYRLAPRQPSDDWRWRLVGWATTTGWILSSFWMLRVWPRGDQWFAR
ncbi:MAG: hypothetical protein GXP62_02725 [Oligoflexia bacterium]|nr:hypothetical protein [Oligoflexia bacterium]